MGTGMNIVLGAGRTHTNATNQVASNKPTSKTARPAVGDTQPAPTALTKIHLLAGSTRRVTIITLPRPHPPPSPRPRPRPGPVGPPPDVPTPPSTPRRPVGGQRALRSMSHNVEDDVDHHRHLRIITLPTPQPPPSPRPRPRPRPSPPSPPPGVPSPPPTP